METLQQQAEAASTEHNPNKGEAARLQDLAQVAAATLATLDTRRGDLARLVSTLAELDAGFSRTGVQSFALEGILGELQVCRLTNDAMQTQMFLSLTSATGLLVTGRAPVDRSPPSPLLIAFFSYCKPCRIVSFRHARKAALLVAQEPSQEPRTDHLFISCVGCEGDKFCAGTDAAFPGAAGERLLAAAGSFAAGGGRAVHSSRAHHKDRARALARPLHRQRHPARAQPQVMPPSPCCWYSSCWYQSCSRSEVPCMLCQLRINGKRLDAASSLASWH